MSMGSAMFEAISASNENYNAVERQVVEDFWLAKVATSGYRISKTGECKKPNTTPQKITICRIDHGTVELDSPRQRLRLSAGDIYLHQTHQYDTTFAPGKLSKVMLPAHYFTDILDESFKIAALPKHTPLNTILNAAISSVEDLASDTPRADLLRLSGVLKELVYNILSSDSREASKSRYDLIRERARAYVVQNLDEPDLDIASIAAYANASRATLYRAFEPEGGVREMITDLRLQAARKMLRTRLPERGLVLDVAYSCGFRSPNQFHRSFKEKFGMTPSAFNQKYFLPIWV